MTRSRTATTAVPPGTRYRSPITPASTPAELDPVSRRNDSCVTHHAVELSACQGETRECGAERGSSLARLSCDHEFAKLDSASLGCLWRCGVDECGGSCDHLRVVERRATRCRPRARVCSDDRRTSRHR